MLQLKPSGDSRKKKYENELNEDIVDIDERIGISLQNLNDFQGSLKSELAAQKVKS